MSLWRDKWHAYTYISYSAATVYKAVTYINGSKHISLEFKW
jgi:hypothetical protein